MPETLGDAVLYLRTDDSAYTSGVNQAEGKARTLSGTLDKTSASSGKLTQQLAMTGRAASTAGTQFQQAGSKVVASAGAQRAGMQQLGMQVNDMATMYALGARPMQIFSSQIGQVTQAIQLMGGGTSKLASFLGGPWGMAITTAAIVLTPFISKLFEADQAAELAEEGANALATAQSSLGEVFDMVSGKLKTQNELLLLNARLTAANLRADAMSKRAGAIGTLTGAQQQSTGDFVLGSIAADMPGKTAGEMNGAKVNQLLRDIGAGKVTREQAIKTSEGMDFTGTKVTRAEFQGALRDAVVANLNDRVAALIDQSLDSGQLAQSLRQPVKTNGAGGRGKPSSSTKADKTDRRVNDQLDKYREQIASAEGQTAQNAEEEAEFSMRRVDLDRRQSLRAIETDKTLSAADKKRLESAIEGVAESQRQAVELRKQERLAHEAEVLADDRFQADREGLKAEYDLAETQADRQRIALQIFDAEEANLRAKLEAVTLSETANDLERQRAQIALDALNATGAARRERVAQSNETETQRYLRNLNQTPGQINEALDHIKIEGLDALNEGLTDAIMGAESLGDAFKKVANQIVADLLRIAIQQTLIQPLANLLFPGGAGGGGPANLLAGTSYGGGGGVFGALGKLFSGFFATGGLIPSGTFGVVGENGPEPVIGTSRGAMVLPNSSLRSAGSGGGQTPSVVQVMVRKGEMFDVEVTRISGDVAVQTVREAAPTIVEVSAAETARRLTRPRM